MKKNLICILLVICLFCVGCNVSKENQTVTDDLAAGNSIITDGNLYEYNENAAQNYWGTTGCSYIREVEDGYYYLFENLLYYFDKSSKASTVVCSSLDCNHNTSDCSAYFGDYGNMRQYGFNTMGFEIYDNNFYIIGYEMSEVCDFYLYRVSMDGSEREKICYLYSAEKDENKTFSWSYTMVMHNGYLYGVIDQETDSTCLSRISTDGEITTVFDCSDIEYSFIQYVRCYGDYIYYNLSWFGDEEYNDYCSDLYRYNINTGETEQVIENFIVNDGYFLIDEENIIYLDIDNQFSIVNINTKEVTTLLKWDEEYCTDFSYDGKYLYIVDMSSNICVYDTDGNLIDKIIGSGNCLFGDSEYLFVESSDKPGTDQSGEGWSLWEFDKSQIGSDNKEWTMIGYTD